MKEHSTVECELDPEIVARDIDHLLLSSHAAQVRRFYGQPYWEAEAEASDIALEAEDGLRLESMAEHSWKVADAVMLLLGKFPALDRRRSLELAILHDKLELVTGDWSPIDSDASGRSTHAFNPVVAQEKTAAELRALDALLDGLDPETRAEHEALYKDAIFHASSEARFVAAVDKLCSLTYVIQKKRRMRPEHLAFTIRYARKSVDLYPAIKPYCDRLVSILSDRQPSIRDTP